MNRDQLDQFLGERGGTIIRNPMRPEEKMPLTDAIDDCRDDEGTSHLLVALSGMTVEEAGVMVDDLAVVE